MLQPHAITVTVPPTGLPVSLSEVKAFLLVEHANDDDELTLMIQAAADHAERESGLFFLPRTVEIGFRQVCGDQLELPVWPVRSVASVQYLDATGTTQTWAADQWQAWLTYRSPLLAPAYGKTWPTLREGALRPFWVTAQVGFADAPSIPPAAKLAIREIVAHAYGNKGDGRDPTGELGIPPAAMRLLAYLRQDFYR